MRVITPLLKTVVYPALTGIGAFNWGSKAGLATITYHGVLPQGYAPIDTAFDGNLISPEMLRRQIRALKKHYHLVSPDEVLTFWETGRKLPSRAVLLTCDDGLLNCLTEMLPVLREEEAKCLFFVTSYSAKDVRRTLWYEELFLILQRAPAGPFSVSCRELLMQENLEGTEQRRGVWWKCVRGMSALDFEARTDLMSELRARLIPHGESTVDLQDPVQCSRFGLMTRPELLELISAGMTIGAHTKSHPVLSCQNPEVAYTEIAQCKTALESALGAPVWALAYPFGDPHSITPQIIAMAERAGYRAAFLNFGGGLGKQLPRYALPRIHVTDQMSLAELQAHACGFYGWMTGFRGNQGTAGFVPTATG